MADPKPALWAWQTHASADRSGSSTYGSAVGREVAITQARSIAEYYRRECGYPDPVMTIEPLCAECKGAGKRPSRKSRYAQVTCKACRGNGTVGPKEIVNDIP
jgi:hypothetical protein